ncbi:MAG: cleavage protein [Desulfitobacteriia bacterium]|jgi:hypothetical protein
MRNKECLNCIYAENGTCRLQHTLGLKQPECPYKEETASIISVI